MEARMNGISSTTSGVTELLRLTAVELFEVYRSHRASPVEVTHALLDLAESTQSTLNTLVVIDREGAVHSARESERRWQRDEPLSALDGVPISLKDNIHVEGMPTRFGSEAIVPAQTAGPDSPAAARLREAGAILFGKTAMPDHAHKMVTNSPLTGVTRNPWSLKHSPGGSSGGATAAVCAGLGPIAIGTDGAGSIRIPAAWTGTYGFKPSLGRVPHHPRGAYASLSHVGPICRNVTDAAHALTILSRPDSRDWYSLPYANINYEGLLTSDLRGVRVAFSPRLGLDSVAIDAQIAQAVERAAKVFESLGAAVERVDPPAMQECIDTTAVLFLCFSARLGRELGKRAELLDPSLLALIELGNRVTPQSIADASIRRGEIGSLLNGFFERFDLVLAPVTEFGPPAIDEIASRLDLKPMLTQWCNLTGLPAASIWCGNSSDGFPIGLQIIGKRWADAEVLRASYAYEQARGDSPAWEALPWAR
jgi:aspartyl-tRNA(Asn)/glutamyl-tRNA(Gln) amidotransferase subunit A